MPKINTTRCSCKSNVALIWCVVERKLIVLVKSMWMGSKTCGLLDYRTRSRSCVRSAGRRPSAPRSSTSWTRATTGWTPRPRRRRPASRRSSTTSTASTTALEQSCCSVIKNTCSWRSLISPDFFLFMHFYFLCWFPGGEEPVQVREVGRSRWTRNTSSSWNCTFSMSSLNLSTLVCRGSQKIIKNRSLGLRSLGE